MKKLLASALLLTLLLTFAFSIVSCNDKAPADPSSETPAATGFQVALDLSAEWEKVSDKPLVQGCVIVNTAFAAENPKLVAEFLADYEASINYMKDADNLDTAAQMTADAGILPSVAVAKSAIPRSNIAFMAGDDMKNAAVGFYSALGINNPGDNFYYASPTDTTAATDTVVNIGYFPGTTGLGMVKMINDADAHYSFTKYAGPETIIPAFAKGEIDIAALPTNAAPNVFTNTNGKAQLLAINTLGVLYICTNGTTIDSISDLAGKTIYVPEQAPKLVLKYILDQAGVTDYTLSDEYNLDTLPTAIASGSVSIALLPEPKVTVANNMYIQSQKQ